MYTKYMYILMYALAGHAIALHYEYCRRVAVHYVPDDGRHRRRRRPTEKRLRAGRGWRRFLRDLDDGGLFFRYQPLYWGCGGLLQQADFLLIAD